MADAKPPYTGQALGARLHTYGSKAALRGILPIQLQVPFELAMAHFEPIPTK
ncbi:hypothetical protein A2U01_0104593, partial [Trifolium medium]|nr:hypothetical protein [Trifolium medium]